MIMRQKSATVDSEAQRRNKRSFFGNTYHRRCKIYDEYGRYGKSQTEYSTRDIE